MNARFSGIAAAAALYAAGALGAEDKAPVPTCQEKLLAANETGILRGLTVKPGDIRLVVDGKIWAALDLAAKTGLIETVACMVTRGAVGQALHLSVHDHADNHVVGKYDGLKLVIP